MSKRIYTWLKGFLWTAVGYDRWCQRGETVNDGQWYVNGELHRNEGPAIFIPDIADETQEISTST